MKILRKKEELCLAKRMIFRYNITNDLGPAAPDGMSMEWAALRGDKLEQLIFALRGSRDAKMEGV